MYTNVCIYHQGSSRYHQVFMHRKYSYSLRWLSTGSVMLDCPLEASPKLLFEREPLLLIRQNQSPQHVANNLKLVSQEGLERLGRLIRLSTRDLRIACVFWEYPVPQRPEPCPSHFHRSSNCLRQRPSFTLGAGFASKLHPWCRMMCYKVRHRTIRLDVPKKFFVLHAPQWFFKWCLPSTHNTTN